MRPRTLLVLAVIVGALLALIYFAEDKVASTDERAAAARRLVNLPADEVVALDLEWQGKRVRFERAAPAAKGKGQPPATPGEPATAPVAPPAPRTWRIVEPFAKTADDAAVNRLLSELTGLELVRRLDGAERKDVGLEPPRGSVQWKSAAGEGRLEIGGAVPASHEVVVAAGDKSSLAVTGDGFVAEVSRPAGEWRSREVVGATRDRIERIAISSGGGAAREGEAIVLEKSGEMLRLESPVADRADRDLTDRLLADLTSLRVETFLDPPIPAAAEKALAEPAGVLELTLTGETAPLRIEVGAEAESGKRFWRVGDQAFESASTLGAVVGRPANEWRSRNWTRFENWRIEKARVEEAAGSFELARSDGEWLRDGKKIPFTAASDLLAALTTAKADSLVEGDVPASVATPPRLTVTLSDADGNEERLTLLAGPGAGATTIPARTGGRDVMLLLSPGLVTELEVKIAAVRGATPVESPEKLSPQGEHPEPSPAY